MLSGATPASLWQSILRLANAPGPTGNSEPVLVLSAPALPVPGPQLLAPAGEVWDLVRSLPQRQRTAVVLRYVGDLREEDVAAVMGVTRGTVAATLARARRSLANLLDNIEVEDPS